MEGEFSRHTTRSIGYAIDLVSCSGTSGTAAARSDVRGAPHAIFTEVIVSEPPTALSLKNVGLSFFACKPST